MTEPEARGVLAEVCLGLEHLHEHGFLHRDVKAENVMVDRRGRIKLVDFGLSLPLKKSMLTGEFLDSQRVPNTGSLIYMVKPCNKRHDGHIHNYDCALLLKLQAPELLRDNIGGIKLKFKYEHE